MDLRLLALLATNKEAAARAEECYEVYRLYRQVVNCYSTTIDLTFWRYQVIRATERINAKLSIWRDYPPLAQFSAEEYMKDRYDAD